MLSNSDNSLHALSPLDGRYHSQLTELSQLFSEFSLIKNRLYVEVAYILFLSEQKIISPFSTAQKKQLNTVIKSFDTSEAEKIKSIEKTIKHDVKAVEYYLRDLFIEHNLPNNEYIHFALTSEDTNTLAYSLLLQESKKKVVLPTLKNVLRQIVLLSEKFSNTPFLAKTHGQPAVPTTVGKELFVFAERLFEELQILEQQTIAGKLAGAVGNLNAHAISFPKIDWLNISARFVQSLGLESKSVSTQIISAETYTRFFGTLQRINLILLDFNQDMWRYISDGVFLQQQNKTEVGSSTMPQKINPIDFENSEGNLGLANALLTFFIQKLPISRLQRDLSDSTVKRNFGTALGYSILAYTSLEKGLKKIELNKEKNNQELNGHWEVVTEGLQTVLRSEGHKDAYEQLKDFSRGNQLNQKNVTEFIESLSVSTEVKKRLKAITPQTYTGYAHRIVIENSPRINLYLKESND